MSKKVSQIRCEIAKIANDKYLTEKISVPKFDWADGIAILTPNWLGDAVMCLPAIKQLRSVIPKDCAIFAISIPQLAELFEAVDCVDRVIVLSGRHCSWTRNDVIRLKKTNCGVGVLFNNSIRDAFFFRLAMPFRRIYGASARARSFLLTRSFKFPKHGLLSKEHHHASRCLSIAYALGAETWDGSFPEFMDIKEAEITQREILDVMNKNKLLAVAPGAAYGLAKKWPIANFAKVCNWWIHENHGHVVVLGTKAEAQCATELVNKVNSPKLANFAGKTDIQDLIGILKKASLCISNDSGIMHLSAATGGAGIAIFGSTNPFATGPLSEKWMALYSNEECSPCLGRDCQFSHYNCLNNISPEDMIVAIILEKAVENRIHI